MCITLKTSTIKSFIFIFCTRIFDYYYSMYVRRLYAVQSYEHGVPSVKMFQKGVTVCY